jgi:hypothetical protein
LKNISTFKDFVYHNDDCVYLDMKKEVVPSKKYTDKNLTYYSFHATKSVYDNVEFLLVHEGKMMFEFDNTVKLNHHRKTKLLKYLDEMGYVEYVGGKK